MKPDTYTQILETVVLSLLDERKKEKDEWEEIPNTDEQAPSFAPKGIVNFHPLNIRDNIKEERAKRKN